MLGTGLFEVEQVFGRAGCRVESSQVSSRVTGQHKRGRPFQADPLSASVLAEQVGVEHARTFITQHLVDALLVGY